MKYKAKENPYGFFEGSINPDRDRTLSNIPYIQTKDRQHPDPKAQKIINARKTSLPGSVGDLDDDNF